MSADLLKRAAEVLRKHADAATLGPWRAEPYVYGPPEEGYGEPSSYEVRGPVHRSVVSHQPHEGGGAGRTDAEYIALMHPPVALALAAVLDEEVPHTPRPAEEWPIVILARAILRQEAP